MAVLRVDHPDILDFVRCKGQEGDISNFNISVGITDDFMRAVEADQNYDLINPQDGKTWKQMASPTTVDLRTVWAISPSDVYAVGGDHLVAEKALVHYDGQAWSTVTSLPYVQVLNGVWASSSNNVFVVGMLDPFSGAVVLHYDGASWTKMVTGCGSRPTGKGHLN